MPRHKRHLSAKTDTVMAHGHLAYRTWTFAFYLASTNLKGVSSKKLGRDLGVSQKTTWMLAHKIRQGWLEANTGKKLSGDGYDGNCPCLYSRDSAGNRCGASSAYSRSGGASPKRYQ